MRKAGSSGESGDRETGSCLPPVQHTLGARRVRGGYGADVSPDECECDDFELINERLGEMDDGKVDTTD